MVFGKIQRIGNVRILISCKNYNTFHIQFSYCKHLILSQSIAFFQENKDIVLIQPIKAFVPLLFCLFRSCVVSKMHCDISKSCTRTGVFGMFEENKIFFFVVFKIKYQLYKIRLSHHKIHSWRHEFQVQIMEQYSANAIRSQN